MKKTILTTFFSVAFLLGLAQQSNNIVIFSQEAKPFYAIVNGVMQNATPQTSIKITGISTPSVTMKIVFADGMTPEINKNTWFDGVGKEATFQIVQSNSGYTLSSLGVVNISNDVSHNGQPTTYQTQIAVTGGQIKQTSVVNGQTVTQTTTTQETVREMPSSPENMNVGMNMGDISINMNVNIPKDAQIQSNSQVVSSQTTVTQTTSHSGTITNNSDEDRSHHAVVSYVPNYSGSIGCDMPEQEVSQISAAITKESFSDDKMRIAKQALRNRCVTVSQVRELIRLFDFEDDKLDFAKFAYKKTYDIDNYYLVNQEFEFDSTIEELDEYIQAN